MGGAVAFIAPLLKVITAVGTVASAAGAIKSLTAKPPAQPALPPPPAPLPPVAEAAPARVEPPATDAEAVRRQRTVAKRAAPKGRRATILTSATGLTDDQNKTTLLGG